MQPRAGSVKTHQAVQVDYELWALKGGGPRGGGPRAPSGTQRNLGKYQGGILRSLGRSEVAYPCLKDATNWFPGEGP